jgi:hypothetical protein
LLESLRADPLDDFDRELFGPDENKPKPSDRRSGQPGESDEEGDDLEGRLPRELGPAGVSEEASPLLEIARQMRHVEGLIGKAESGPKTQNLEDEIVTRLEELLKQARSRSQGGSPSPRKQKTAPRQPVKQPQRKPTPGPGKPDAKSAPDSKATPGRAEARKPDLSAWQAVQARLWGELPQKAREQMLQQLPVEEFLPKYEVLIEEYFKRLAEEPEARKD